MKVIIFSIQNYGVIFKDAVWFKKYFFMEPMKNVVCYFAPDLSIELAWSPKSQIGRFLFTICPTKRV